MKNQSKNKHEETLNLASEILRNIELSEIPLEKICLKCTRLARLCGDDDYEKAFKLEISGYGGFPNGIPLDVFKIGKMANRVNKDKEGKEWCTTTSISQLETIKKVNYNRLEKANDPDVSISFADELQHIALMNKPDSILNKNTLERKVLSEQIVNIDNEISKRMGFVYSYVYRKYHKLCFENEIYSIFKSLSNSIESNIFVMIPEGGKKIISIIDNLKSSNAQDWKNILATCRNLLIESAGTINPQSHEKYYNVLKQFVQDSSLSKEDKALLEQDITVLIDPLNEGTHNKPVSREKAEELFIRVCLCLSKIIELKKIDKSI